MSTNNSKKACLTAGIAGLMTASASGAGDKGQKKLIAGITDSDAKVRTAAWLSAGEVGAVAVKPLAKVMTDSDLEVARAAKRGLWKIVRHVGRPGASIEKLAVTTKLSELLSNDQPVAVRREVLWMLSEIGSADCVRDIAALLKNKKLREDARMTLERIPTRGAVRALKTAMDETDEGFKSNLAQSLRKRGERVSGYPCVKMVPQKG
ncbi:MAG: HEAT repeat domain-containing protein [Planctomycetes bacterium]|nr:HEAT repeat domain-containing protein [Planctomycetota bacterium]